MAEKEKKKVYIKNRRASFDYEFLERYTAGIVLVGTEIKSVRAGKASLSDAFCYFDTRGQLYVKGMNIAQYFWGSWGQHQPERDRKLLLTKKELRHGFAKVDIALARGKKEYDKRQTIKENDIRREMERGE